MVTGRKVISFLSIFGSQFDDEIYLMVSKTGLHIMHDSGANDVNANNSNLNDLT